MVCYRFMNFALSLEARRVSNHCGPIGHLGLQLCKPFDNELCQGLVVKAKHKQKLVELLEGNHFCTLYHQLMTQLCIFSYIFCSSRPTRCFEQVHPTALPLLGELSRPDLSAAVESGSGERQLAEKLQRIAQEEAGKALGQRIVTQKWR